MVQLMKPLSFPLVGTACLVFATHATEMSAVDAFEAFGGVPCDSNFYGGSAALCPTSGCGPEVLYSTYVGQYHPDFGPKDFFVDEEPGTNACGGAVKPICPKVQFLNHDCT